MKNIREWSPEEHQIVIENLHRNDRHIAKLIGRTAYAVSNYRKRKGITKKQGLCGRSILNLPENIQKELLTCRNIPLAANKYGVSLRAVYRLRKLLAA